ncbi:hypothetical protein PsYK624_154920 [Phanerochaete sordida]|uniref:Uncharacterized protein n=1 Tax=Phanerochaete sordida TaxID=48140 RepID=A0A9P3GPB6_9APHY|nr:hypothetical protein PsYK624_154920 [Phanerochaete sordida]
MRRLNIPSSVTSVLLRDSTAYFFSRLALDLVQLLTFTTSQGTQVDPIAQALLAILVQRFMLNLRQVNPTVGSNSSDMEHFSRFSITFKVPSSFLGNIGESAAYDEAGCEGDAAVVVSQTDFSFVVDHHDTNLAEVEKGPQGNDAEVAQAMFEAV